MSHIISINRIIGIIIIMIFIYLAFFSLRQAKMIKDNIVLVPPADLIGSKSLDISPPNIEKATSTPPSPADIVREKELDSFPPDLNRATGTPLSPADIIAQQQKDDGKSAPPAIRQR